MIWDGSEYLGNHPGITHVLKVLSDRNNIG